MTATSGLLRAGTTIPATSSSLPTKSSSNRPAASWPTRQYLRSLGYDVDLSGHLFLRNDIPWTENCSILNGEVYRLYKQAGCWTKHPWNKNVQIKTGIVAPYPFSIPFIQRPKHDANCQGTFKPQSKCLTCKFNHRDCEEDSVVEGKCLFCQGGVALTERAIQQGKIRREEAYQNKKPYYRKDGGKFITGQARKCYFEWPQFFINDYEVAHLFFGGQFIPQNKGGRRRKDQKPHAPSIWSVQPQDTARPSVTSLTGSTNPMHMSSTPPIFASHPPHSSTQTSTLSFSAEELSLFGRVPSAAAGQDNGSALQALRNTNTARAPWFNANNRIYRNPRPAQTTSLPHETNTGTLPSQSFDSSAQDHNDVLMDLMDNNINRPNHSIAGNPDQSEQEHQAPTTTILSAANEDEWDKFVRATFPVHSPEILSAQEWWTAISEQASKQTPPQQAPPNASPIGNAEADHTTTPVQTQTTDNLTIPDADLAFYRGDMYGD